MKKSTKRIVALGIFATYALSLCSGLQYIGNRSVLADEIRNDPTIATTYFYDNLTLEGKDGEKEEYTLAKKFYNALSDIYANGDFKDGRVEYLIPESVATTAQIKGYVDGTDLSVPKAFSAARDAFLTDHPELFYIDFYKLTISVGRSNGVYKAYIDSGREANLYRDNSFSNEQEVSKAINDFNAKINKIAADAVEAASKDLYYTDSDIAKAKYVNKYLAENTEYDYVAYDNMNASDYVASAHINTPYGGLVSEKAVCGGFSTAFKVVMDRLGIPCITVNGYSNQKDETGRDSGGNVYHMWNYIWLADPADSASQVSIAKRDGNEGEGDWYSVDVTWNSSAANKQKYMALNAYSDGRIHVSDGVISSSGYKLTYPELSAYNYGGSSEVDGLKLSAEYRETGRTDDYGNPLMDTWESISYNGKSAKKLLEEDGLRIVFRNGYYKSGKLVWDSWKDLNAYKEYVDKATGQPDQLVIDSGYETKMYSNTSVLYSQYAVSEVAPDVDKDPVMENAVSTTVNMFFSAKTEVEDNMMAIGEAFQNEAYGTYTPPPFVSITSPSHQATIHINDNMRDPHVTDKVTMAERLAYDMHITYNEELHVLDPNKPIEVAFVTQRSNTKDYAKFIPLDEKGTIIELLSDKKTLRFKFCPSLMYEHNMQGYTFVFSNVGSSKELTTIVNGEEVTKMSNKIPNSVYYNFGRPFLACPARFNYDGRLWIDCCAQPTLVANSDLSDMDFKDEGGNSTFSENERSQMMLVVDSVNKDTENAMFDEIDNHDGINIKKDDIKTSETYDIKLQICNKYPTISDGSYVKIALGFPEGYGPNDAGVTFKLFHRKHIQGDEYIIEEIPCVVTQFGIVATVTSFSPYMVAVVDADKASPEKTVYTSIEGKGGKLNKADGMIKQVGVGGEYTCTIKPDDGYQIYKVTLNHVDVTDKISNGKLKLSYSDLAGNNEVEIQYIAKAAVQRLEDRGDEIIVPSKVTVSTKGETSVVAPSETLVIPVLDEPSDNTVLVACLIAGGIVVALGATAVAVVLIKRKSKTN